jgi:hypothetical protein
MVCHSEGTKRKILRRPITIYQKINFVAGFLTNVVPGQYINLTPMGFRRNDEKRSIIIDLKFF